MEAANLHRSQKGGIMNKSFDCEKCVCEGVCLCVVGDVQMPENSCEYYHPEASLSSKPVSMEGGCLCVNCHKSACKMALELIELKETLSSKPAEKGEDDETFKMVETITNCPKCNEQFTVKAFCYANCAKCKVTPAAASEGEGDCK